MCSSFAPDLTVPCRCVRLYTTRRLLLSAAGFVLTLFPEWSAFALPVDIPVRHPYDDGEEVNNAIWKEAGGSFLRLGQLSDMSIHDIGVRFLAPELASADTILFARLRFSARGGELADSLLFSIEGALEVDSPPLSQAHRPSLLPRTSHRVVSRILEPWANGTQTSPMFYYSEDISPVINEIIHQPGWGADSAALILCLDDVTDRPKGSDYIAFSDCGFQRWPVTLQVCRTAGEAFLCDPALARPTDTSILITFIPLIAMEGYAEYGRDSLESATPVWTAQAGKEFEFLIDGLEPATHYRYRMRYRPHGFSGPFEEGMEGSFQTQRAPGSSFTFTVEADSHIWDFWRAPWSGDRNVHLYQTTLDNVARDTPDFHLNLGDVSMTQHCRSLQNAFDRYAVARHYLGTPLHSVPFYLVEGNHEGELGWLRASGDSVVVWAEKARHVFVRNPAPDDFYAGCPDSSCSGGPRESYYAWEWGDALFVVLDPFWYATVAPYPYPGGDPEEAGWQWTLGRRQYEWLHDVLAGSDRRWKLVFLHHLTGGKLDGLGCYGRGGIETAKWQVAHRPSFEWGGEDSSGTQVFAEHRPGWEHSPVHDLLVHSGVSAVIHGHDHLCAFQELDDIAYIECPAPTDATYSYGYGADGAYTEGTLQPNSGHLRFRVGPDRIVVEYVRAWLAGDGDNGEVAFTWLIPGGPASAPEGARKLVISVFPDPVLAGRNAVFRAILPQDGAAGGAASSEIGSLSIYDASGRLTVTLRPAEDGSCLWDLRENRGRPVPSGVYYWLATQNRQNASGHLVVIR